MPIVLAGAAQNSEEAEYSDAQIRPRIDGKNVTWAGPVTDEQKVELFRDAAAQLFPIQGDEAFGLVMIEAMACGVPVVARKFGAVSEVVDYGQTGFYAGEVEEVVTRAPALDRKSVREHPRQRFSPARLAEEHAGECVRSLRPHSEPRFLAPMGLRLSATAAKSPPWWPQLVSLLALDWFWEQTHGLL